MESLKRSLAGAFLPVCLCLFSAACCAQQADPYVWDFGRAKEGVKLEHIFLIANNSQTVLKIREVTSSCGCTASEVSRKELAPGESAEVKITFDTAKYSGSVEQFVYVNTDSPDRPVIRLTVKAEIVP